MHGGHSIGAIERLAGEPGSFAERLERSIISFAGLVCVVARRLKNVQATGERTLYLQPPDSSRRLLAFDNSLRMASASG